MRMMEELLSLENLLTAIIRVEANKGSHGVDGMSVRIRELKNSINTSQAGEATLY
jgi:hypothetical protein